MVVDSNQSWSSLILISKSTFPALLTGDGHCSMLPHQWDKAAIIIHDVAVLVCISGIDVIVNNVIDRRSLFCFCHSAEYATVDRTAMRKVVLLLYSIEYSI